MNAESSSTFAGREAFRAAVRELLARAVKDHWRDLRAVDTDFRDWPLNEPGVIDSLRRWARPGSSLTLLARDYGGMHLLHPRFVEFRRDFGHLIDARAPTVAKIELPVLMLGEPAHGIRLLDRVHWRGAWLGHAGAWQAAKEQFDASMQQSEASFPATTLGI